jgi:hypothetical protein
VRFVVEMPSLLSKKSSFSSNEIRDENTKVFARFKTSKKSE